MARAFPNCGHAADLEVASTLGTASAADTNKAILALALEHQIVSTQTSLVAIDKAL
jgi:Ca-activated chloride channel family protein